MNRLLILYNLFSKKQKIFSFYIFLVTILVTIFELLGLSLIIPIVSIILDPDSLPNYLFIKENIDLDFDNEQDLIILISLLILIVYFVKNFAIILFTWMQTHYIFKTNLDISNNLFQGYLKTKYEFFLKTKSSLILRNVVNEVNILTQTIHSMLILLSEFLIFISICILLLWLQPMATIIVVSIFGCISLIIHFLTRKNIFKWGEERQDADNFRIKNIQEIFRGIKEIKIYNTENFFIENFSLNSQKSFNMVKKINFVSSLPRQIFEYTTIIIFIFFLYYLKINHYSGEEIISLMALFAIAAFRLLPSFNKILGSYQRIIYNFPVIDLIENEFKKIQLSIPKNQISSSDTISKIKFENLTVKNLLFEYEKNKPILQNIQLKINKNEMVGIIGESGSGKTTLINLITGLFEPTSGEIYFNNIKISKNYNNWQNIIGYVSQNNYMLDDTIKKNIILGSKKLNNDKLNKIIKDLKLDEYINNQDKGIESLIGEVGSNVSGGQMQRISIARALYRDAQILIFDEPTSALDFKLENQINEMLFKLKSKYTIIIISHKKGILKYCDKIFELENTNLNLKKNES